MVVGLLGAASVGSPDWNKSHFLVNLWQWQPLYLYIPCLDESFRDRIHQHPLGNSNFSKMSMFDDAKI